MPRLHTPILFLLLSFISVSSTSSLESQLLCTSQSQPNPISTTYPNNVTGTINGTLAILPIPLSLARAIVPPQYAILTAAIQELLPSFPKDMYPCLLHAVHDHDISIAALGLSVPDFSRADIDFPFLDLLADGSTPFRWVPELLITASNIVAIGGAVAYGSLVHPATFAPECDAYSSTYAAKSVLPGAALLSTFFAPECDVHSSTYAAKSVLPGAARLSTLFAPLGSGEQNSYDMVCWRNVTNQPSFANGLTCDEMVRYFNTSVSTGENAPVFVKGRVEAKTNLLGERRWEGLFGVRTDSAFVENNYLSCPSLRGYGGRM